MGPGRKLVARYVMIGTTMHYFDKQRTRTRQGTWAFDSGVRDQRVQLSNTCLQSEQSLFLN